MLCLASVATAQEQKLRGGYALGLAFSASPDYPGAARISARLRPVLAVRYGRLRLSSSGGSSVLNFGSGAGGGGGSGASADLFDIARIKVRGALRIANGRNSSDFDLLRGLPDVERTVLGRLSASYRVTRRLSADARLSWDLFGRGNGVTASAGLQYRLPLSRRSMWSMGARLTWADASHMRSWFGVPASAQTALRPQYSPGAGAQNIEMNMGIIARVSPYWVMFARFGVSRLMGEAAASPLTEARVRAAAQIGIGYTCCRAN